jgi:dihydroorotase-like cyclic amidohydrolase
MTLMKMMTSWPAEYVLREDKVGTLAPGKFADIVVLNKDYFTVPQDQLPNTYPVMTIVGGKIEVIRAEFAKELGRPPLGPQIEFKNGKRYAEAPAE